MTSRATATRRRQSGRIGSGLVFAAFGLIALFFLVTEHRAHLFGWLPFLLLLACPLLHMSHGHGSHGRHREQPRPGPDPQAPRSADPGTGQPPAQGAPHHHH